jgi:hypothetical protein
MTIAAFSASYAEAREKFLAAATAAGAALEAYDNPNRGPDGGSLATDTAWLGPDDARRVLVLISGTHGVEGFCGSGIQVDWLCRSGALPADTAVLLIHAMNPHGFAWLRRVTEEGCDLNRNHVDHGKPYPENPGYDDIADDLLPPSLTGPEGQAADARLLAYREKVGELAYYRAVASGQFRHPDGLFFGGGGPAWANRTLHRIIDARLRGRSDIGVIDFHTGLGPFGYGEMITDYDPDGDGAARVRAFWGDSATEMRKGQTVAQVTDGATHYGFMRALPDTRVTFGTLEFGTYDRLAGQRTLRADHWLHKYGDPLGPEARPIKAAIRRQYYPDTPDWKEAVLFRGDQAVRMALAALRGASAPRGEPTSLPYQGRYNGDAR